MVGNCLEVDLVEQFAQRPVEVARPVAWAFANTPSRGIRRRITDVEDSAHGPPTRSTRRIAARTCVVARNARREAQPPLDLKVFGSPIELSSRSWNFRWGPTRNAPRFLQLSFGNQCHSLDLRRCAAVQVNEFITGLPNRDRDRKGPAPETKVRLAHPLLSCGIGKGADEFRGPDSHQSRDCGFGAFPVLARCASKERLLFVRGLSACFTSEPAFVTCRVSSQRRLHADLDTNGNQPLWSLAPQGPLVCTFLSGAFFCGL